MADKYRNFQELSQQEGRGSFSVRCRPRHGVAAVVAPHGGKIEPGTSEVAEAIAGTDLSFYVFEGTKASHNATLHITSTLFDEPRCRALIALSPKVVAIHGEASVEEVVFLGGRDTNTCRRIRHSLRRRGFAVKTHPNQELQGYDSKNLCNRGTSGGGIQLELSKGLRLSFFRNLTASGRRTKTQRFQEFVDAVREALS